MLGYTDLKDPSVSGFFRFLARVGDGMMKMQIVKINLEASNETLVYGAGVLGRNLARNLFHAGKDVTLLARGNPRGFRKNGLRIKDQFSFRTSVSNIPVVTEKGTECPVRCDICRPAIYAAGFCSGNLAGESDEKYCFVGNNVQARALAAALRRKISCLPLRSLPGIGNLTGSFLST